MKFEILFTVIVVLVAKIFIIQTLTDAIVVSCASIFITVTMIIQEIVVFVPVIANQIYLVKSIAMGNALAVQMELLKTYLALKVNVHVNVMTELGLRLFMENAHVKIVQFVLMVRKLSKMTMDDALVTVNVGFKVYVWQRVSDKCVINLFVHHL